MTVEFWQDFYAGWFPAAFFWGVLVATALLESILPDHRAKIAPAGRIKVNLVLGGFGFAIQLLPLMTTAGLAAFVISQGWGLLNQGFVPAVWQIAISFLALDLLGYAIHRLSHRNRWLWRLHRVHHTDVEIDLSTLLRNHPLTVPIVVFFEAVAIFLLGLHPLGALLHGSAKLVTMAFGHAAMRPWPRFSKLCAMLFVTPAFHHRHHSAFQPETDSNYGEVLSIWDRLFGTNSTTERPVARFGLGQTFDAKSGLITAQLRLPFERE